MTTERFTIHKYIENSSISSDVIDFYVEDLVKQGKTVEDVSVSILDNGKELSYRKCVDLLNQLNNEIKKLRTLNYVNKEAVRLNCIQTVKIGNNDVDCSNIDWELLYELYGAMIDYYYEGDVE